MRAIRGAICAQNTAEDISAKALELVREIFERNNLQFKSVSAIIFTATPDLDACYPATAVREWLNDSNVAFLCAQEMAVKGSLDHCIRVCVIADGDKDHCSHCYLGKASVLRPDLQ